jgi:hypothetical protein
MTHSDGAIYPFLALKSRIIIFAMLEIDLKP